MEESGFALDKKEVLTVVSVVEYRKAIGRPSPGRVLVETESGVLKESNARLQPVAGIVSDTIGLAFNKTQDNKCPVTVAGRVLAFPFENKEGFRIGDPVCSAPNGCVSLMTREEVKCWPDRVIGIVSEIPGTFNWGPKDATFVNGRIWIRVR